MLFIKSSDTLSHGAARFVAYKFNIHIGMFLMTKGRRAFLNQTT